jgi:ABC-type glycerol-3-phosphate transport system substrate-binding protein
MGSVRMAIKTLVSLAGIIVLAVMLVGSVSAGQRTLTVIAEDHWVPSYNPELKRQIEEWGAKRGVTVQIDFVGTRNSSTKLSAELVAKKGHDLITMHWTTPGLYQQHLAPLDDVAAALEKASGPWTESARYLCYLGGHWRAIPSHHEPSPANINVKHWKQIGFEPDQVGQLTWDQFLDAAKRLKEQNHPVGMALSTDGDAANWLYPLLWSFGGRTVDKDGKIVVDSKETRNMMEYVKKLYPLMPREVVGWSGADNNICMHSEICSWTSNGPTIYGVARMKNLPVLSDLDHVPFPSGPAGKFTSQSYSFWGIWNFSPNIDLAKDLLAFLMQKENYYKQIEASWGVYLPDLKAFEAHPVWHKGDALRNLVPEEKIGKPLPFIWPAPQGPGVTLEYETAILSTATAKAATGDATVDEAVAWLKNRLEMVHRK